LVLSKPLKAKTYPLFHENNRGKELR